MVAQPLAVEAEASDHHTAYPKHFVFSSFHFLLFEDTSGNF
jgi:hypothetical protein